MTDPDATASHSDDPDAASLREMIVKALDSCDDAQLLDMIYKLLIYTYRT